MRAPPLPDTPDVNAVDQLLPFVTAHPLHRAMGVRTIETAEGRSTIEVTVGSDMVNAAGMFHGGIVYTLCDMACYAALLTRLQPGENAATHDIHVSLLGAARLGERVRFTGTVLRLGRSVAFMDATAHSDERLLARATVTKSILRPRA